MTVLAAALTIVAVVLSLNLLLLLGVLRRVREHDDEIARMRAPMPVVTGLPPGARLPRFEATTVSGEEVTRAAVTPGLVAFLSSSCHGCREQLPGFLRYAAGHADASQVLAVVVVDARAPGDDLVSALGGDCRIVVEGESGPLSTAFSIGGYPSFFTIDASGRVVGSAPSVRDLPTVAAPA
jgi:hypothetical protein